jgi:hypothetical protein
MEVTCKAVATLEADRADITHTRGSVSPSYRYREVLGGQDLFSVAVDIAATCQAIAARTLILMDVLVVFVSPPQANARHGTWNIRQALSAERNCSVSWSAFSFIVRLKCSISHDTAVPQEETRLAFIVLSAALDTQPYSMSLSKFLAAAGEKLVFPTCNTDLDAYTGCNPNVRLVYC